MTDTLFRILYCSRNRTGEAGSHESQALNQILRTARVNNRECGITGALLFSSGYFAQVLEGTRADIERTFERIQRDERHGDITVLESTPIDMRDFPNWSMARVTPTTETQASQAGEALNQAMGDPGDAGRGVLALLRTLVIQAD